MGTITTSVECSEKRPVAFCYRGKRFGIAQVSGRWCLSGHWWEGEGELRFYRVQTRQGPVADLCFHSNSGEWRLARFYD